MAERGAELIVPPHARLDYPITSAGTAISPSFYYGGASSATYSSASSILTPQTVNG